MAVTPPKLFVGLHAHSCLSTFDGLGWPQEHIDYIIENGGDAWALTDHGNMNGYAHGYLHTKKINGTDSRFKFIGGVEAYYHPDLDEWSRTYEDAKAQRALAKLEKKKVAKTDEIESGGADEEQMIVENEDETKDVSKWFNPVNRRHHLVLLPKSQKGLENIFSLVTRSYKEGFYRFPRVDRKMLKQHGEDVIALSACIGGSLSYAVFYELRDVPSDKLHPSILDDEAVMNRVVTSVGNAFDILADALGKDNVYVEIQFNKLIQQHIVNRALIEFARRTGAKLVATCDSHYPKPTMWKGREMYKKLGWLGYENITPESIPKSIEELKCELFPKNATQLWETYLSVCKDYTFYTDEVVKEAIENSWHIAHDVIGNVVPDISVKLPSFVVPPNYKDAPFNALVEAVKHGLRLKGLDTKPQYIQRAKQELEVIKFKGFELYFLTMKAIFDVASNVCLLGPGRGSAAGSLVNYVLGITQIDPIKYDLLFGRFLTRSRTELPDIDSDVADRDLVINALSEKYGAENIIPISNFNTLQLKSLTKDISKFHGIPFDEATAAVSTVEQDVRKATTGAGDDKNLFVLTYEDAIKHSPKYAAYLDAHPEVAEHIQVLYKQPRAIGRHAGGVLVAEHLSSKMPLIGVKGELQSPWVEGTNVKHLNEFGFAKFDILGLETLRIIHICISLILKRHFGIKNPSFEDVKKWFNDNLHPDKLDMDDTHVYENVYQQGKWCAIFQFTSPGAQKFVQRFNPTCLNDIAVATSIYRPGPLAAKVDDLYIDAIGDLEKAKAETHPNVWKALESTKGLIVFQEQLMQLAIHVAGFSEEESERVRKTILKQSITAKGANKEKREQIRKEFVDGCIAHSKMTEAESSALFDKVEFFCGYGFNRSMYFLQRLDIVRDGTKMSVCVKDVVAGDLIRSRDESTGDDVYVTITALHDHGELDVYEFVFDTGDTVRCTLDHKFRTIDGRMLPIKQILTEGLEVVLK